MANDYCTLAELKADLIDSGLASSSDYDTVLTDMITAASRLIDREAKRKPGAFAMASTDEETRYYTGSGCAEQWVDELASAPSYVGMSEDGKLQSTDYTTVSSTDYFLWPDNASEDEKPYHRIDLDNINGAFSVFYTFRRGVKITGVFGYALSTAIPSDINKAAIITASRWFKRAQQGYQDSGAVPELGQLRYTKAIDPDVEEILAHYKRVTI